jgi:hypothetical protein
MEVISSPPSSFESSPFIFTSCPLIAEIVGAERESGARPGAIMRVSGVIGGGFGAGGESGGESESYSSDKRSSVAGPIWAV